ncbi:IclR family transcriptional regulator [Nocardiopsis sp. ATB16-24]|uniref:IclR family transcriptional regulator n=1 Tax=Nocardiopsis sp. ATB16-24 TaxID=3019555 RepID=UPI002552673A|nr:IclR family transcriptional regulator [Nocardiopsis sp. ATB16-24]
MTPESVNENGRKRDPVARAFQVLTYMIEQPQIEFGVREIAKACELQPSTVHRALGSLIESGVIVQDEGSDNYRVGLDLLRLWSLTHKKADIRGLARKRLQAVVEACNETVILGLYDRRRRQMLRVDSIESSHPLRYVFDLFQWTEIYRGASGLSILANLPDDECAEILAAAERAGDSPWPGRALAQAEIDRIREQGYAVTRGRRIPGAVGISAPIFDHQNDVVGSFILTVPEQRIDDARLPTYVDLVVKEACALSRDLGALLEQDRKGGPSRD